MIDLNESNTRLRQFQACFNRHDILPDRTFRREGRNYELVSYVNNITGLLLSSNFDAVPNLVARACEHMGEVPAKTPKSQNYYSVVSDYLSHVVFHFDSFLKGSGLFDENRISIGVLRGGPKQAPNLSSQNESCAQ